MGLFDGRRPGQKIVVTGSVRLPDACWQVTMAETRDRVNEDGIRVAPAIALLRDLV